MDFTKLPKIRDEDREAFVGYVYGVSGPGRYCFVKEIMGSVSSSVLLILFTWKWRSILELWVGLFLFLVEGFLRKITDLVSLKY